MQRQRPVFSTLSLAALMLALATPAWALYKVVGPDGRVTYTDRPPSDRPAQAIKANGSVVSTDGLPFELQRIVGRYPVTLYTGNTCAPCDSARQYLKERGIPFAETTIITSDDVRAMAKLDGANQVPMIRIGSKQMQGYNQQDWAAYLDAAGYPASSALPPNYRWPAAAPLVPQDTSPATAAPAGDASPRSAAPPVEAPRPAGPAPSGFKF